MIVLKAFRILLKVIKKTVLLLFIASVLFIAYRGNQPMSDPRAPEGMTYFEFIADRMDAARTVKPSRCGWGMMGFLAVLGPIYSVVYTAVAVDPDGPLASVTAPDPNIGHSVANAAWYTIPNIWWETVERLSWSLLGEPPKGGCKFRPVQAGIKK